MTPNDVTDPTAVRAAAAEYDRVGELEFLSAHHFGPARRYVVVVGGREYDSKAILGVAHGYQYPEQGDLDRRTFSGGRATTVPLERMGFEVRDRLDSVRG